MADEKATYAELLRQLSEADYRDLTHRKLDCIMQGIEYLWNSQPNPSGVSDELQVFDYPQPNVIIYTVPSSSGHPPFAADSDYIAEDWPWPDVPPKPEEGI